MAPQSWATAEEREFLISLLPEYEACQVKRKYKNFWLRVNKDFLAKFPVVAKLYPGVKESELTEEQRQRCAGAIAKVQKRIKEWYRWQMNPRSRNAGFTISKKDLHSIYNTRTRVLKPYEVYAKLYQREVEEAKRKRCEEEGIKGRQQLSVWHEVARELYLNAPEERVQAVKREMSDNSSSDTEEGPEAPKTYLRYLKKLPTLLDATVSPAVKKAGVLALVTIVGPDPEKCGKIVSRTLQFGDKPDTPLFSNEWANYDKVFVEELARFARRHEFSPAVCASRSLRNPVPLPKPTENSAENPITIDDKESEPVTDTTASAQVPNPPKTAHHSQNESSQTASISCGGDKRDAKSARLVRVSGGRMVVQDSDSDAESDFQKHLPDDPTNMDDEIANDGENEDDDGSNRHKDILGLFDDDEDGDEDELEEDGRERFTLKPLDVPGDWGLGDEWDLLDTSLGTKDTAHPSSKPITRPSFPRFRSRSPTRSRSPSEADLKDALTSHTNRNPSIPARQLPSLSLRSLPILIMPELMAMPDPMTPLIAPHHADPRLITSVKRSPKTPRQVIPTRLYHVPHLGHMSWPTLSRTQLSKLSDLMSASSELSSGYPAAAQLYSSAGMQLSQLCEYKLSLKIASSAH
ncbi:hypothetical protein NMY22_g5737 [Coprinellus aureogranulatus]|nr:hypothetical protein NMY22_g5737 [Coprinellus aureogranulatus]